MMSWVKKRGQPVPAAVAPPPQVQMYNPNEHSSQENQWQQQGQDGWYNQPQKQDLKPSYWQPQYQQTYNQNNQQFGQYYQNSTPYQQQNYGNLQYNQQYNAQNNLYETQQQEGDGWSSNWGWGDEDNSNVQIPSSTNTVTESFANDGAWNWSLDDAANVKSSNEPKNENKIESTKGGKRNKLETPQWSIESQVSQESSDDILQTSESDKSRMLSRSSTISHSPISGQEHAAGNFMEGVHIMEGVNDKSHFENKEIVSLLQDNNAIIAPPPLNTSADDKTNLYKRNIALSHAAASKFRSSNVTPPEGKTQVVFQPPFQEQSVNLETLPDNSEQPDPVPVQPTRKPSPGTSNPWPENNEAPINDRNQYLETAQLSDVDLNNYNRMPETATAQENDALPPPGLRRMVPGQTVAASEVVEPPEGLRRMIPGESSSPESSLRPQNSDQEFNEQRSATIGADTPPVTNAAVVNRSETIGADISPNPVVQSRQKKGRRDSIEGGVEDDDVAGLVSSVRNLTVGEQPDEGNSVEGGSARRHSRQESSESEREVRPKSPGERRERRYGEKDHSRERDKERNRGRYSPPNAYRDRKYDRRRYKERRYEEDTDYYSDKEKDRRHRDDRDRDYDRKYSSLRKDKEKDRRRRDDRRDYDGRDPRKNDYYYGRYDDDYEHESRSRASSRSDSMHESYRERGNERDRRDRRHKEKERHRRSHRDPFNPYMQGFGYDIYNQYYQQYHYYENLRKTNPQAYAQLYRKYYHDSVGEAPYGGEDRTSVHSGRSSANDELAKDRYTRQSYYSQTSLPHIGGYYRGSQTHSISGQYGLDEPSFMRTLDQTDNSYEDPQITSQRLTPAKFSTAHVKASISSGKLVKILPHYPLDGQAPTVELSDLGSLLHNDEDFQELKRFPGPLVKGTTHKKTIIEYCDSKIKNAIHNADIADKDSYILMWELLILLIRQNGMVVGADIAELLLKNRPQEPPQRSPSVVSSVGSNVAEGNETGELTTSGKATISSLREEEVTNRFREYLLYGSGKEALEWAMKHGLWGHALFLASKLDKRTYANVMMRFANGLTMNDPLQTLYQLLSGRTPAAVTCVADEKWGDWRPHLAMILSNSTQIPELNCKAITILGDTLMGRGSLFAAQFCYLMAEVGFGQYGSADAKLVLLGSNHNNSFASFATNEAIHMTEIYEFARSLNDDDFSLASFLRYKYLLSTRLADVGLLEKSLSYLEKMAHVIVKNPGTVDVDLVNEVAALADKLKYYDPIGDGEVEVDFDSSRVENSWLKDLRRVQNDYNMGLLSQSNTGSATTHIHNEQVYGQDAWQQQQQQYEQYQQQQWSTDQPLENVQAECQQQTEKQQQNFEVYQSQNQQQQQQYWQQQWNTEQLAASYHQEATEQQYSSYSGVAQSEPDQVEKETSEVIPQPQISLPNQQREATNQTADDDLRKEPPKKESPAAKAKPSDGAQEKPGGNGWFGGIFSKLTLKPKNQMKLPDDKNPTIVWDPEKKRWVNTDEDAGPGSSDFKPPPKVAPKPQPVGQPKSLGAERVQENGSPPRSALPNMYKLQKNRNLKKSYIDIFNPNSKPGQGSSLPLPVPPVGGVSTTQTQMNFFVPQPVNDSNAPTDFLTPAPPLSYDENSHIPTE